MPNIMLQCERIAIDGDVDYLDEMFIFPKEENIFNVLRYFNLTADNRRTFNEFAPGEQRDDDKYRGTNLWSHYQDDDGSLCITVDVGCWCAHDCCGCLCILRYNIAKVFGMWIVKSHRGYNH